MQQLMALWQCGAVAGYRDKFEITATQMRGIPDAVFRGAFLYGLREDIWPKLKMHRPNNLHDMMELAQQVEACNEAADKVRRNKLGRGFKSETWSKPLGNSKQRNSSSTLPTESNLQSKNHGEPKDK